MGLTDPELANYDSCSVLLAPIMDQAPLPYIPGLTTTKKTKSTNKRLMPEHVHKPVRYFEVCRFYYFLIT